jgi:hypothetical protein
MKTLHIVGIIVCLILLVQPLMACPYDTGGHLVNIRVIDASGGPLPNATITAIGIKQNAPDWFWSILGMRPSESAIELTGRNGTTDKNGVATLPLYGTMLYNVTIACDNGKVSGFKLYPYENEYEVFANC